MRDMKILRINLDRFECKTEVMANRYLNLGGRGLTSGIIADEVPPKCDPLRRENKLVIAAGILGGTIVPNSGRLSVGAKSPLTHTIKEANAGGSAARKMASLGIQAIVLEGQADSLTMVRIDKKGVTFLSAENYSGTGNFKCVEKLKNEHGDTISVISIGQAGEMKLLASAIGVTSPDFHIRVAARGGLGAVMGVKNIKALIIDDKEAKPPEIKDKELLKKSVKALTAGIVSHPLAQGLKLFGTPVLVNMINEMGAIVTKNYSQGQFDGAEKISGEYMAELMNKRPNAEASHRCMSGCVMSCSNVFSNEKGEFIVSGIEYETIALMGSNCMIDDIDIIAKMNRICNDAGVDTMDVGGAIGVAMEAGMIPWGDGRAALALVEQILKGTEKGRMIGNGCRFTGEKLGVKRIPIVKGQCLSGYDPRGVKGTGVTYATSTMGADHTCGNALPSPANPDYNHLSPKGQKEISGFLQTYMAAIDTLGLCLFASLPTLDIPELQKHLIDCTSAVLDEPLTDDYIMRLGEMVLQTERKFNKAAGFGPEDDRLPDFFTKQALSPNGHVFDVSAEDLDSVFKD